MSASRWTTCPRCSAEAHAAKAAQHEAARAAYGVLPIEEFERLRAEADKPIKIDETVREDYEFYGFEDGLVRARYKGACMKCGLEASFLYEFPVKWEAAR